MKYTHARCQWIRRLATCATLGLVTAGAADFYVSPVGPGPGDGSHERPFVSLEQARDAARAARKADTGNPRVTVWLTAGDYTRTNSLALTAEDSGITWRALEGQAPRLLGARRLPGLSQWSEATASPRLSEQARSAVLVCEVPGNVSGLMTMKSRGFARPTAASHAELFYGGKPMTLARWPNEGEWEKIAGFPDAGGESDSHGGTIGQLTTGFFYSGDRPSRWQPNDNLWVHGYWAWDWANSYERVASLDLTNRHIKTVAPFGQYGFRKGQRFYFVNVLEELDTPGEYFLDTSARKLFFWPPEPIITGANKPELLLSVSDVPLLRMQNCTNVVFRGIVFEGTRSTAVTIRDGSSNRLEGCVLRNIGNYAVTVSGGAGHTVVGCDVFDTGDGGVMLEGGDRATLTPCGHVVENCHFARQGRWSKCYVPAVQMSGVGTLVHHNLIHDHPHCAILFNGNDHDIAFNEIHHIALETGDVGAIYTGRDYTYRGNRIRHNFIHETGGVGMGSMGVYMDDCVSGTEIYGNVFYKVQRAAFLGGGRDHRVVNNIFVDCNYAVELDGRGLNEAPVWRGMVNETMRNSLKAVPAALYRERYPEMKTLDEFYGPPQGPPLTGEQFKGVPPEHNVVSRNVAVGKWLHVYWGAKLEMLQLSGNVTNATSSFEALPSGSAKVRDFKLKADSPVWQNGFKPIPLDKIGLHEDELRKQLP